MQIYTEMITTGALLHGDQDRFLDFSPQEQPVVLQLGGSSPTDLAACVKLAAQRGYSEVNLNLGCPSPRVQKGAFGACLMAEKTQVMDCVKAMQDASDLPISIKCRLGIDDLDSDEFLLDFLSGLYDIQCRHWLIHARIALLNGLSPKENRTVPPLNYPRVHLVKRTFPSARVIINGGLSGTAQARAALQIEPGLELDGAMLGRAAYQNPQCLLDVDAVFFAQAQTINTSFTIADQYSEYLKTLEPIRQKSAIRHTLGLFNGYKGAKLWRRQLSEGLNENRLPLDLWYTSLNDLRQYSFN